MCHISIIQSNTILQTARLSKEMFHICIVHRNTILHTANFSLKSVSYSRNPAKHYFTCGLLFLKGISHILNSHKNLYLIIVVGMVIKWTIGNCWLPREQIFSLYRQVTYILLRTGCFTLCLFYGGMFSVIMTSVISFFICEYIRNVKH